MGAWQIILVESLKLSSYSKLLKPPIPHSTVQSASGLRTDTFFYLPCDARHRFWILTPIPATTLNPHHPNPFDFARRFIYNTLCALPLVKNNNTWLRIVNEFFYVTDRRWNKKKKQKKKGFKKIIIITIFACLLVTILIRTDRVQ